jgi:aminopeptidase N
VRVWAPPGDDTQAAARVPLQLAVAALQHYQTYTGVSQSRAPATKWDLVAVPGKSGAVENWGLVVFDAER